MVFFIPLCYSKNMNRRNYQRELERIIARQGEGKPSLLLHCCCAPCASSVLEYLTKHFKVTIHWYNPNIYPLSEYERRFDALRELLEKMGLSDQVDIIKEDWRHEEYLSCAVGLEKEPEGGLRCPECFRVRLKETARLCSERGFDWYCSSLTLSRHKDAVLINAIGEELAKAEGCRWLPSDFKKKNGENRSIELCEEHGIYRQLYCGCEFSLHRRVEVGKTMGQSASESTGGVL